MTAINISIIGLAKGGLGGTLAALATPLLALIMPADKVIGLLLPILIIADILAVVSHWMHWNRRMVLLLIPGGTFGMIIGSLFIANTSPETLRFVLGIITLLFVIYKVFEQRSFNMVHYTPKNWHGLFAGSVAGVSSTLAHTAGPLIAIYLLMQNITPRVFVATAALYFLILNCIKVPSYYYIGLFDLNLLWQIIWLLPLLPLSVWIGKRFAERIDKDPFDKIITVMLLISALLLIIR